MGGFTKIFLRDSSIENIRKQNEKLKEYKVARRYHFYSDDDIAMEYHYFQKNEGYFPKDQFPKNEINSFEDFKRYWSPVTLGEVFVPHNGCLIFDCYYGRTSKRAMRNIGKYLYDNADQIKKVGGSFTTFMERGMTKKEQKYFNELLQTKEIQITCL